MSMDQDDNSDIVSQSGRLTARLLLSLATAVLVFVTTYYCAWKMYYLRHGTEQYRTRRDLNRLGNEIEEYRQIRGKLPEKLQDLEIVDEGVFPKNEAGQAIDIWNNPYQYEVKDGNYQLFSFGRDGKPGGVGLDADQYAGQTRLPFPTLAQFTALPDTFGTFVTCLLTGLIVFPICLFQGREKPGQKLSLSGILGRNALTALFALFIAWCLAGFYWSGH